MMFSLKKRLLIDPLHFCFRVMHHFINDQCVLRASALAYASLLAIVPLLVLMFAVFSHFNILDHVAILIQDALIENLLPTSQQTVSTYLSKITAQHAMIPILGMVALVLTVTALLNTIEEALNHIWGISTHRTWLAKLLIFCLILIITPVLIATSIAITSYFAATPLFQDVADTASSMNHIPFFLPWVTSSFALTVLYVALPNSKVPIKDAMIGAFIAGILFELCKLVFTLYITYFSSFDKIYGILGTLPVFLIWLYITWIVILLGAEIVFCLQHPHTQNNPRNKTT